MEAKYQKSDFKRISWEEYGRILEKLYEKVSGYISKNNIKISAIVPILRGGAFPGLFLAYKLKMLKIIPVQYKYLYKDKFELKKLSPPIKLNFDISDNPTFLLVENNHCFGSTGVKAAEDLKKEFPNCKIIYAAAFMDYSNQNKPIFDEIFFGELSNEARGLTEEEAKVKNINHYLNLFPWENLEEEFAMVSEKPFDYNK